MKPVNSVLSSYGVSIFETMARLSREHGAINLGQGAPGEDGPADVIEFAARALTERSNQHPPLLGLLDLRKGLAEHDRRFYGLDLDPEREILIALGATEALACAILALIKPGDEAVLIEPLYDSYLPILKRAGGIPKLVRLEPPDWKLSFDAPAEAFTARTKFVLVNTRMNPVAKVFGEEELRAIAQLCLRHDAYAVCEVYEHTVFDGRRHIPLLSLPGTRDRTIRIGSAGRIFPLTAWKVGFMMAAPEILGVLAKTHRFLAFTTPPNLQRAIAYGLGAHAENFAAATAEMTRKRDLLAKGLADAESSSVRRHVFPDRGYPAHRLQRQRRSLLPPHHYGSKSGRRAGRRLLWESFGGSRSFARFCFAKPDAILTEAGARLSGHFRR